MLPDKETFKHLTRKGQTASGREMGMLGYLVLGFPCRKVAWDASSSASTGWELLGRGAPAPPDRLPSLHTGVEC